MLFSETKWGCWKKPFYQKSQRKFPSDLDCTLHCKETWNNDIEKVHNFLIPSRTEYAGNATPHKSECTGNQTLKIKEPYYTNKANGTKRVTKD